MKPTFQWKTLNAEVKGNFVYVKIPNEAEGYYIELKEKISAKEYITTSVFKRKN